MNAKNTICSKFEISKNACFLLCIHDTSEFGIDDFRPKIRLQKYNMWEFYFFFETFVFSILQKISLIKRIFEIQMVKIIIFSGNLEKVRLESYRENQWKTKKNAKKSFFSFIFPIVQTRTPPQLLLWKRKKVSKLSLGKNTFFRENMIINWETIFASKLSLG